MFLKAGVTDTLMITIYQMAVCNMSPDEPTEDYHLILQLPSAIQSFILSLKAQYVISAIRSLSIKTKKTKDIV